MREFRHTPKQSVEQNGKPETTLIRFSDQASKAGADIFIRVSMQHPASVARQGAAIALEYRNPEKVSIVGEAVLEDEAQIIRIAEAANRKHEHSKKDIGYVTPSTVKSFMDLAFWQAERLAQLPEETLKKILTYQSEAQDANEAEMDIRTYAERLLDDYLSQ